MNAPSAAQRTVHPGRVRGAASAAGFCLAAPDGLPGAPPSVPCSAEHFHPGPERVTQLVELSLPQLHTFLPESFCSLLFSLACLRCRPGERWFACHVPVPSHPVGLPFFCDRGVGVWHVTYVHAWAVMQCLATTCAAVPGS